MKPVLYIFSGLPGVGKSTLARALARFTAAAYVRIDTVEQALRDLCAIEVQGEGYRLAYRIASDNLGLGRSVVADACNPIELTREEWHRVALDAGARYVDLEVICSDPVEHRRRVEARAAEIPGLVLPRWQEVQARVYHPWTSEHITIDTAGQPADASVAGLVRELRAYGMPVDDPAAGA